MSEEHPRTLAQLRDLPGMTPEKIAAYGVVFLDVTRKYAQLHEELTREIEEEANKPPKKKSKKYALFMSTRPYC